MAIPVCLEHYAELCPKFERKGRTLEQRAALGWYQFCLREEDRYTGSVFYRPDDRRSKELEARSREASAYCHEVGIAYP